MSLQLLAMARGHTKQAPMKAQTCEEALQSWSIARADTPAARRKKIRRGPGAPSLQAVKVAGDLVKEMLGMVRT